MEHRKEKAIEIKAKRSRLVILGSCRKTGFWGNTKVTDGAIRNVWWWGKVWGRGRRCKILEPGARS
jgi:hypothetical protein